ncbi:MAG: hypothetical protein M9938_10905 [Solirubrobacterales bacterium]|nr:hypothetical protein [Solirubrobacterales bacterium]
MAEQWTDTISERSFCIDMIQFPNADSRWLNEKAAILERLMRERLGGKLEWHSVVPLSEDHGFRISFVAKPSSATDMSIPRTVLDSLCQVTGLKLPKPGTKVRSAAPNGLPTLRMGPRLTDLEFSGRT